MLAYEFFWFHPTKGYELLGILPERRKNPERITQKSVMNWVERVYGNNLIKKDIYFVQVTNKILEPIPFFVTQKKV